VESVVCSVFQKISNYLTSWVTILLEKLTFSDPLKKKVTEFYKIQCSLQYLQQPAICPYPNTVVIISIVQKS
jgi:hypothetical protein